MINIQDSGDNQTLAVQTVKSISVVHQTSAQ